MNQTIFETLNHIGLYNKKARTYIACLELGSGSASMIAKKAGLNRTTVYEILGDLASRGLISTTPKERGTVYVAESPEHLNDFLKQKERDVTRILPELHSVFNRYDTKPRIRFYEGVDGVRGMLQDTLTTPGMMLRALLSVSDFNTFLGRKWFREYTRKRVASGKKLRVLRPETKEVEGLYPSSKAENREVRLAPRTIDFSLSQYMYDNKVLLISTAQEGYGMIIESKEYFTVQLHLFETLWSVSRITKGAD